jgi:hypothetical protein
MRNRSVCLFLLVPLASACFDELKPQVAAGRTVRRNPGTRGVANASSPSSFALGLAASEESQPVPSGFCYAENPDTCSAWTGNEERSENGEFEILWTCDEGGNGATSREVGRYHEAGGKDSVHTFFDRDGNVTETQTTVTTFPSEGARITRMDSSLGAWYLVSYERQDDGSFLAREESTFDTQVKNGGRLLFVGTLIENVMTSPGVFKTRRLGVETSDDLQTEASPDWRSETFLLNGDEISQHVLSGSPWSGIGNNVERQDGSISSHFVFERAHQEGEPDYRITWGWDDFDAPLVLEHRWTHDDGSSLVQTQGYAFSANNVWTERWVWDDAATSQFPDQVGDLVWNNCDATGTMTTYVSGGDAETCDVQIGADGAAAVSNCR